MRKYYYFVSSLFDLFLDQEKKYILLDEFLNFAEEQLDIRDFIELKKLFLFNDIKNIINYQKNNIYLVPSYYSLEEFLENQKDIDSFFNFIATYYFNKKNDKRVYKDLTETDELILLFYEDLNELNLITKNNFIIDYYNFELDLKNISLALTLRKNNQSIENKLIPYGFIYEKIIKNFSLVDFGLANDFQYIDRLLQINETEDLIKIEKQIEDIRWDYLDELVNNNFFGLEEIFSYAIKLLSVERWLKLKPKKGEELLNKLIEQIKGNIKFPQDFFSIGGKK